MTLSGKRALVTGGSRGVGAATVKMLAERGASVAVNYVRSKDRADEVVAQAHSHGVTAVPIAADVSSPDDARSLVADAVAALGGLDILINNAATTRFTDIDDLDGVADEAWQVIFATNVQGLFDVTRAAAPHLRAGGDGIVVNVGSVAGIGDSGSSIPYCASKAAVHSLTRTLAPGAGPRSAGQLRRARVSSIPSGTSTIPTRHTRSTTESGRARGPISSASASPKTWPTPSWASCCTTASPPARCSWSTAASRSKPVSLVGADDSSTKAAGT